MRQSWPEIPVILASGYADLPDGDEMPVPRLAKPYQQVELAAAIAEALGGGKVVPIERARRAWYGPNSLLMMYMRIVRAITTKAASRSR